MSKDALGSANDFFDAAAKILRGRAVTNEAFQELYGQTRSRSIPLRRTACVVGIGRVGQATELRGV